MDRENFYVFYPISCTKCEVWNQRAIHVILTLNLVNTLRKYCTLPRCICPSKPYHLIGLDVTWPSAKFRSFFNLPPFPYQQLTHNLQDRRGWYMPPLLIAAIHHLMTGTWACETLATTDQLILTGRELDSAGSAKWIIEYHTRRKFLEKVNNLQVCNKIPDL
jgi:hypothetical protein